MTLLVTTVADHCRPYPRTGRGNAPSFPQLATNTIDLTNNGTPAVTSAMNNGAAIVDYVGHGSIEIWGTFDVFNSANAPR